MDVTGVSSGARQVGSTIFKNTVLNTTREEGLDGIWYSINPELRECAKSALLDLLTNPDKTTMKCGATCISAIAT